MIDYTHHLLFAAPGTAEAVRAGKKDQTRRLAKDWDKPCRWRVGAWARCYERDPRAGGEPFGRVRITSVVREQLLWITHSEVIREGARASSPEEFVRLFLDLHKLPQGSNPDVWRIEFADFSALEAGAGEP